MVGGLEEGVGQKGGGEGLKGRYNEVVLTPLRHFPPSSNSLSPFVFQNVHNRLVIRERGLRLCTLAICVAGKW